MLSEDNVTGKISDERFARMSGKYEQEQGEISKRVKSLKTELRKERGQMYTADTFLEIVRKYANAQELTQRMVVELVVHIDVYHIEKTSGLASQRITIYYNCIGAFEAPRWDNIPELDITLETRKGVALCYSQFEQAV